MEWKKVPKQNEEILDSLLGSLPEAEKKKMFGCPVYFLNGNMLAGAHQESIFLRLSEDDQEEIFKHPDVTSFSPMAGRIMREYVVIPISIYGSPDEFKKWLAKAKNYVASLPVKEPKPRKMR